MDGSRFATIQRQPLSESVYRQLEAKIVGRELVAGSPLPSERLLAEMLGVNRGAVREAIKRLQQAGLVAVRQGGNHLVLDYRSEGGLELLPSLLIDPGGQVDPAVARAALALRAALAPEVAAAAATLGGARLATRLERVLTRMRGAQGEPAALQALALEFWSVLVDGSDNIAFRLAFNTMNRSYRPMQGLLTGVMQAEFRDLDNLAALVAAVRARDADAARSCAERHVALGTRVLDAVLRRLPPRGPTP